MSVQAGVLIVCMQDFIMHDWTFSCVVCEPHYSVSWSEPEMPGRTWLLKEPLKEEYAR